MDESYYLKPQQVESIIRHCERKVAEGCGFKVNFQSPDGISGAIKTKEGQREYDTYIKEPLNTDMQGNSRTITAHYHKLGYTDFSSDPTVTSSAYADNNFLVKDFRIRKLTPRECFRLMDVADSDIDKIQQAGISKTQQYKLAGNSIVVSCLYHVFRKMFIDHSNEQKGYVQLSLF